MHGARFFLLILAAAGSACTARGCGSTRPAADGQGPAAGVRWSEPIEVASGRAHAGQWRMNDSNFDYVDDPTVAWSEAGSLGVAWVENARKDVFFRTYDAEGRSKLSAAVNVSQSPQVFSWLPRVSMAGEQAFVLWQEIVFSGGSHGGDIFFSRSIDAGASFSAPLNLSRSIGGDGKGRLTPEHWDNGSLDLLRTSSGTLFAAWSEYDGALWLASSDDDGQSFSAPTRIGGSPQQPARGPCLAYAQQSIFVVWSTRAAESTTLLLAESHDGGQTFRAPRPVTQGEGNGNGRVDAPKIAADDSGVLHLVYGERSGEAGASRVNYARRRPGAGSFEAPRTVSSRTRGAGASFPSLSLGAPGQVVVVWQHQPSARVEAQGIGSSFSRDGGKTFSAPELVPGSQDPALGVNGGRQGKLMRLLAVNAAGTVAVASSSFLSGHGSRVRVFRGQFY